MADPTVISQSTDAQGNISRFLSDGTRDTVSNTTVTGTPVTSPYTGFTSSSQPATTTTTPSVSSTTISNGNKMNQVPGMVAQTTNLTNSRGQVSDANGNVLNQDGSSVPQYQDPEIPQGTSPIYGTVNGQSNRVVGYNTPSTSNASSLPTYFDSNGQAPATSAYDKASLDLLDQMKSTTDATLARTIQSIQQKFAIRKQQQDQTNAAQQGATQNILLTGGVTGQGSSSQYAPLSSQGIVGAQEAYGIQQLAELDSQEQDLINSAQAAADSKNYSVLEKKLALIDKKKEEKAQATEKLNQSLLEENKKQREAAIQAPRDNAIADLFSSGVVEPADMLKQLNADGKGNYTLDEIDKALKIVGKNVGTDSTKNLTLDAKEFYQMKDRGQLPKSIADLPTDSEQLNAYLRNKAIAKKAPANSATGTTVSGKLTYSKQDASEDSKALEASRGADGYVDPTTYGKLYSAWVSNGGLLKDFLTKFPPKNYVNPVNQTLPVYLRPAQTKSSTTSASINDL